MGDDSYRNDAREWRRRLNDTCGCGHSRGTHAAASNGGPPLAAPCLGFTDGRACACPRFDGPADDLSVFLTLVAAQLRQPATLFPMFARQWARELPEAAADVAALPWRPQSSPEVNADVRRALGETAAGSWAPLTLRAIAERDRTPECLTAARRLTDMPSLERVSELYTLALSDLAVARTPANSRAAWTLKLAADTHTGDLASAAQALVWCGYATRDVELVVDDCAVLAARDWQ